MSLVVDSSPFSATCNSYISTTDMEAYVNDQAIATTLRDGWLDLDPDRQAGFLVRATAFLDSMVTWIGDRYSRDQKLKWPRYNAIVDGYYVDNRTFPAAVVKAAAEMALFLMTQDGGTSQSNSNARLKEVEVGPLRIDFNNQGTGAADKFFPDSVALLVQDFGTISNPYVPGLSQIRSVRLQRA